uniref:Putative transporter n=1 Tax=Streptoalloteichus sp. ATCC 53650 TaxID=756733 RepID=K4NYD6_9PSEU|nr:putative transporter [Streptoalloteichus sp. ATCC 53650]
MGHVERPAAGPSRVSLVVVGVAIVLIATNLRPAITALSPLLPQAQAETGFSAGVIGLLTTVPMVVFAILSGWVPGIGRRVGLEVAIAASMVLLVVGFLLRLAPSGFALFGGTVVVSVAISVGNVLLPTLVKRDHPRRVGLMTGLYTMGLNIGPALAAGLTIPLQEVTGVGWRGALALWAVLAGIGLLCWVPVLRRRPRATAAGTAARRSMRAMLREPLAWAVTVYFALLFLVFYTVSAWLPKILVDAGLGAATAGTMLSAISVVAIPFALLSPILAGRTRSQVWLSTLGTGLLLAGFLGVLLSPLNGTLLWMVLLGIGQGVTTGVCFVLIVLRSPDAERAAQLAAMTQTVGYVLAAGGPWLVGALHDLLDSWTGPLVLLIALVFVQLSTGLIAGRDRQVGSTTTKEFG